LLPFGLKVIENIKQIVREEMNRLGSQELIMTSLQRKELWEKTDRWDDEKVDVWFKSKLKNGNEVGFGWSHEEQITEMMKSYVSSYRDLPRNVYQFQNKLRNEVRAKSGIMRCREFIMKDMYSYSRSEAEHEAFYNQVIEAYLNVFKRVGLGDSTFVTFASGGAFTQFSHEFQTISEAGEDLIFKSSKGEMLNREVVISKAPYALPQNEPLAEMKELEGVGMIGVQVLADYLKIPVEKTTKTLFFETDTNEFVVAAVRGDYDVDEGKLVKVLNVKSVVLASPELVKKVTGAEIGYAGLINLPSGFRVIIDDSVANRINFECGANKTNYHAINVNFGRDIPEPESFYDIKVAKEGDLDPETLKPYEVFKAAEVGNIFSFGSTKSEQLGLYFSDEDGVSKPVILGSYGIGITRLMGVIVEKFHDDNGIVWPKSVAPYNVHIVDLTKGESTEVIEEVAQKFESKGQSVVVDDRDLTAGEKLSDADLIGIPLRIVISKRSLDQGGVAVKPRTEDNESIIPIEDLEKYID
jgi:prolyl-tRNA synthetase